MDSEEVRTEPIFVLDSGEEWDPWVAASRRPIPEPIRDRDPGDEDA